VSVLAALTVGVFCALLAASLLGIMPAIRFRPGRGRRSPGRIRGRVWLQQAGLTMSPVQFWVGSAFAGLVAVLVLAALTGSVFVALVPALAVASFPRAYFARRRRTRLRAVQLAWPDGLRDLLASIAAGRSLTQAVGALAATGPAPLRDAFAHVPEWARVLGTAAALELVREDLADPTSDRVIEVLRLAHERGGAVVRTILEDLVETTTRDLKLAEELETASLEMRINARTVVVLPWLVLVVLTARPGPFREFYRSGGGVATVVVAAGLSVIGVAVLSRLGREVGEPRVLVATGTRS